MLKTLRVNSFVNLKKIKTILFMKLTVVTVIKQSTSVNLNGL